jgi:hypothetical protein
MILIELMNINNFIYSIDSSLNIFLIFIYIYIYIYIKNVIDQHKNVLRYIPCTSATGAAVDSTIQSHVVAQLI